MLKFFKNLAGRRKGFTLTELLVTIVIASIILASLLTFLNIMLNSERQEQAKATAELEIQEALDYIATDLEEAAYIYDADGINAIKSQLPNHTAIERVPVLVFWKRTFLPKTQDITNISGTTTTVGCLVKLPPANTNCDNRDYFIYSLIAYYLIKDDNPIWSSTARIGRWEIQDGIKDPYNSNNYLTNPDPGFKQFDLSLAGSLTRKMNAWTKSNLAYTASTKILIDYLDHSTGASVPPLVSCTNTSSTAQQVPANGTANNPLEIYSFYACVDSSKNLARVYLRGNALARIEPSATYTSSRDTYFPTANVQVQSRGLIAGE